MHWSTNQKTIPPNCRTDRYSSRLAATSKISSARTLSLDFRGRLGATDDLYSLPRLQIKMARGRPSHRIVAAPLSNKSLTFRARRAWNKAITGGPRSACVVAQSGGSVEQLQPMTECRDARLSPAWPATCSRQAARGRAMYSAQRSTSSALGAGRLCCASQSPTRCGDAKRARLPSGPARVLAKNWTRLGGRY
jgi:hypothetical protein